VAGAFVWVWTGKDGCDGGRGGKVRQCGLMVLEWDLKRRIGSDERYDDVDDGENAEGWSLHTVHFTKH
jgi:hypothetical protein